MTKVSMYFKDCVGVFVGVCIYLSRSYVQVYIKHWQLIEKMTPSIRDVTKNM